MRHERLRGGRPFGGLGGDVPRSERKRRKTQGYAPAQGRTVAENHAGPMRLGGQAKERQLLQGGGLRAANQAWAAKGHRCRRCFSPHRHLPHAQGRNPSPRPWRRLFRPARPSYQAQAAGEPNRPAWLRSNLATHRHGRLRCKKERRKNQCLNALFLFRSESDEAIHSSFAARWIASAFALRATADTSLGSNDGESRVGKGALRAVPTMPAQIKNGGHACALPTLRSRGLVAPKNL